MAMKTATITVDADVAQIWNAAPAAKRKQFQTRIRRELDKGTTVKKEIPRLSQKESDLLLRINRGFSPEQSRRIDELIDKMEFESISEEEHAELMRLTDVLEADRVERLEAVIELAKHRKQPIDQVMKQLGMEPGRHAR